MRRIIAIAALGAAALLTSVIPAHAAGTPTKPQTPNWNQHDTAVYVVSTLNLLHTRKGQPITATLTGKLSVTHYDVLADTVVSDLYFIQLRRDDGTVAGALAYQLGWQKPQLLTLALPRGVCKHAADKVMQEYRSDAKQLIGSFTSTLPR
jgi:hypothetical protein